MISIVELHAKSDLIDFVRFPFNLYKGNKYWVPPIISDEIDFFDPTINPVFEHAEARFFLARKGSVTVGRIAAIRNFTEIEQQRLPKMRFGWFDFIDDYAVSSLLLDQVTQLAKEYNLEFIEGPVGFSNMDKVGVLTEGFDRLSTMISWYNFDYYSRHYEAFGMMVEKRYSESEFLLKNADPKFFEKSSNLIGRRYQLQTKHYYKTSDILEVADQMFDLFNETYASLSSFVPISDRQKAYFKKKYLSFINPEFIKFVFDKEQKMIAFAITMPSFATALRKANGKLFPWGIIHLLLAKRRAKTAILYLIGVHPDYQNKGVTALLFAALKKEYDQYGIVNCHRTPELEDNLAIQRLWKDFYPTITQKRVTYKKDIGSITDS
jgi:GNAT superfamily N-acetyltransferase